jgi:hypothetical protein
VRLVQRMRDSLCRAQASQLAAQRVRRWHHAGQAAVSRRLQRRALLAATVHWRFVAYR